MHWQYTSDIAIPLLAMAILLLGVALAWSLVRFRQLDKKAFVQGRDYSRLFLDSASVLAVGLDTEGHVTLFNRTAETITGYTQKDLEGKNWFEVLVPRDRYPQVWEEFTRLQASGVPDEFENPILTATGEERIIAWRNSILREGGAITGTLSFGIDVTERRRGEKALERRASQATLLSDIGSKIGGVLELQSVLDRAAHLVQESFGYHHVALFTVDRERGELVMTAKAGRFTDLYPPDHRIRLGQGMVGWVGNHGERLLANDVRAEPRYINLYPDVIPTRSELCMPIRVGEENAGVLDVQSPALNAFDENDVMVLETLANQVAVAIANARLYESAQRELAERKRAEAELRAQKQLFENLVSVARATAERLTLQATLHNALDVSVSLTGAEQGDLFLMDASGAVTSRVLVSDRAPERRQVIFERVMERGLAGWVARHRQAALIADTSLDDRWLELPDQPVSMRSALSVPILSGPAVLGVLTLTFSQPGHFTTEHLHLMQAASDQMALAVRNAQIFDEQRRMADRQMTLYQIIREVSRQLDPDAVARSAAEAIAQFAGWPHVAIVLPDQDQQHWVTRAGTGILSTAIGLTFPLNQGTIGRTIRTTQTQLVPDVSADPDCAAGHPDIRSELAIPLRHSKRLLGVLDLESDHLAAFDADDVLLAESLADAVALALDNARLHAETRQRAADLSALYAISRATSQSLALDEVLVQALSSAMALFGFDAGLVSLVDLDARHDDEKSTSLHLVAHRGLPPAQLDLLWHGGLKGTLCAYALNQHESMVIGDLDQEQSAPIRAMTDKLTAYGWRAYAGIPLLRQKEALGVLCLFARKPRTASAYDLALLTTIGHQVTTAVENARLFQSTLYDRSRLQALIKSTRDGVLLIGMEGGILVVNAPALRLLGLPGQSEDWLGWRIKDALRVLHIHAPKVVRALLEEMRRAKNGDEPPGEGEFEISPRVIHWHSLPVMAGTTPLGRLLLLRDVTDERAVERLREDMTGTMVHDLRNPLSAISSALTFLNEDAADSLSSDQREILQIGLDSSQRMLELVNSILDVSRLESGRMPLNRAKVEMDHLIAEMLRAQSPLAVSKGLSLESDAPPTLPPAWVDAELIGRVLQNLVGNAIKFTPSGGVIRLGVKSDASSGHAMLLVSVCDNGPGIPDEIKGRLFQRFVSGRQQEHGSGLGLAFCKVAVEAHGGRIWVESAPGQGTTFTFSLPICLQPAS
jgi:PAS domain S-box-containing protein